MSRDEKVGIFSRIKSVFEEKPPPPPEIERRSSKRVALPIPVMVQIGEDDFKAATLKDLGLLGLSVPKLGAVPEGAFLRIQFGAYEGISEAFQLQTRVCRLDDEDGAGMVGVRVDREETSDDALRQYRRLVLHYVRHRPLLEDLRQGYFEGGCTAESCNWLGRVGAGKPVCSMCGSPVKPLYSP